MNIENVNKEFLNVCADITIGKITMETASNLMKLIIDIRLAVDAIPLSERKTNDAYYLLIEMGYVLYRAKEDYFS